MDILNRAIDRWLNMTSRKALFVAFCISTIFVVFLSAMRQLLARETENAFDDLFTNPLTFLPRILMFGGFFYIIRGVLVMIESSRQITNRIIALETRIAELEQQLNNHKT